MAITDDDPDTTPTERLLQDIGRLLRNMTPAAHWFVAAWLLPLIVIGLGLWVIAVSHDHVARELAALLQNVPLGWFGLLCGTVLLANGALMWRAQRKDTATPAPFSRWWVLGGVVAVIAATWASTTWMLAVAQPDQQLSAIQSGLTVAAGTGGALGLALVTRKQWHQENVHLHERQIAAQQQRDADEQRFLESYTTALQLLESESSQTRQGGLALLESIGENYPDWQATVVRVLCNFLRRPLPSDVKVPSPDEDPSPVWLEARQERQQAIGILVRHLPRNIDAQTEGLEGAASSEGGWGHHRWDLAGAVIPALDILRKELRDADFRGSVFVESLRVERSNLSGADFTGADLSEGVWVVESRVVSTSFDKATFFDVLCIFQSYLGHVTFRDSSFGDSVIVGSKTRFTMGVDFTGAQYTVAPEFRGVLVDKDGWGNKVPGWTLEADTGTDPWRRLRPEPTD